MIANYGKTSTMAHAPFGNISALTAVKHCCCDVSLLLVGIRLQYSENQNRPQYDNTSYCFMQLSLVKYCIYKSIKVTNYCVGCTSVPELIELHIYLGRNEF